MIFNENNPYYYADQELFLKKLTFTKSDRSNKFRQDSITIEYIIIIDILDHSILDPTLFNNTESSSKYVFNTIYKCIMLRMRTKSWRGKNGPSTGCYILTNFF